MGRPNPSTPPQRFSPYKRRSPLGVITRKIGGFVSSALEFSGGLRRSFSKVMAGKPAQQSFTSMPLEVLFQLFDLTAPEDLVRIASLNHANMNNVFAYINSERFVRRIRDSTVLLSTKAFAQLIRLCYIINNKNPESTGFYSQPFCFCTHCECAKFIIQLYIKFNANNANAGNELDNGYWGKLITNISLDWNQADFYAFLSSFADSIGLRTRMERFLNQNQVDKVEELALRRILRPLFLNNCSPGMPHNTIHQLYFRLSALLQLFGSEESLTHRVMLLLGAPINVRVPGEPNPAGAEPIAEGQEFVDYHRLFSEPIHDQPSAAIYLGELPMLSEQLLQCTANNIELAALRWTELEVFNFLEMLTTYPEPWVLRNFASMLISAPTLARVAVYIRAQHGDPIEAGNTLFSCIEASEMLEFNAGVVLRDTMQALATKCNASVCFTVLREAISTIHHLALETIGVTNPVDADEVDLLNLKNALEANRHISELFLTHLSQLGGNN